MYLKKIIAQGFKSFADKITIDLTSDITAIVGPNGSGKSNVVDAIRWVLGEQSVKSLRGESNMTDVIFQGSKSRPASNVASVTLVFDNTDNYINLNFSEISIKRRVYRDGTNEYYVNNEQCRLKDITNILLDNGMAKESFNIISQGQIDEIIMSKPTERRLMIEASAGVLKYKKRKEDALKKLDKTNTNMNRVNDIINELDRQIEPLKKEKDQALKYLDIKEELEKIEIALIANDITNLNYKYQDKQEQVKKLNQDILDIGTTSTTNETKLLEYKMKLTKLEDNIKNNQTELLTLTEEAEKLNGQKKIILERKKYEVDNQKLHENIVNLKETQLKLKNEININELKINNTNTHLQELNQKIQNKEKDITKIKQEKTTIETKLTSIIRQNMNLNQKIINLKENIENNNNLPTAVKHILNNPKLKGIHNIVGNLIEVEEKYTKAITTTLGNNANNIVIDDEQCAKEAIKYLKENNLGRATFYPISIIKSKTIKEEDKHILNNQTGYINIASNLVKYDTKYQNIITNQLGNIIVVDNIDSANKISKQINYKYKIVTLEGELFHIGGAITGGGQTRITNTISLKYELEEKLKEQIKQENNIKELENQINEHDHNLKSLEDELYLLNKDKINTTEIQNNQEKTITELQEKLQEIEKDLIGTNNILEGKLSEEEEQILKEYYKKIRKKDEITSAITKLTNEKHDLEEAKEQFEHQVKKENTIYNTKSKELKELEIEVNRLDVKLDTLLNTLTENYNMTYEKASTLYKLELDQELARNKVNKLKKELKEIGNVNVNAPVQYAEVSERYEFLINQREDLVNAEATLLDIIKEMDNVMIKEFKNTFSIVNKNFQTTFKELFKGGSATLNLTEPENILETGVEIVASPPGKKLKNISLLSGGEKTLTAISLLFAILKSNKVPFCILDEVEAALDEVNVDSFCDYVTNIPTQFIIITHKKRTMEYANTLYGITMQESGVSKLVSVKLEEIK